MVVWELEGSFLDCCRVFFFCAVCVCVLHNVTATGVEAHFIVTVEIGGKMLPSRVFLGKTAPRLRFFPFPSARKL